MSPKASRPSGVVMPFRDRRDAGEKLGSRLAKYREREDVLVLALPRGGVVTGHAIARILKCPLDVLIVRKLGFPGRAELAVGAVSETGSVWLNKDIIDAYGISEGYIQGEISRQMEETRRRASVYRAGRAMSSLTGKTVILVDDGVATGATMMAAIATLRNEGLARLAAAFPVASIEAREEIRKMVDDLVCLSAPLDFMAVGNYYQDFRQVTDEEVVSLLRTEQI